MLVFGVARGLVPPLLKRCGEGWALCEGIEPAAAAVAIVVLRVLCVTIGNTTVVAPFYREICSVAALCGLWW